MSIGKNAAIESPRATAAASRWCLEFLIILKRLGGEEEEEEPPRTSKEDW